MTQFIETLVGIFQSSGFAKFGEPGAGRYTSQATSSDFLPLLLSFPAIFAVVVVLPAP